ncbi:hypothetical protein CEUSTIGMA_g7115.t1 [Chlamydomonas eustigma]|uniref:VWFA domain-containing protein n=1 Tax=Chlamydomonas eustigma TaxID=1157962 RepID=A0A250X9B9_9CHLO|nr:hypothetical protein CEUSTIGMA_g7115.t1 [Chlamydomonas eustigma]|eukprot:GAX79674.1 hypothetical protein CEUSTIGMA_g7115.t1 [Chlamydomonas eustigma]
MSNSIKSVTATEEEAVHDIQRREPDASTLLEVLPESLLICNILSILGPQELCCVFAACKRTQTLVKTNDAYLWGRIVHQTWASSKAGDIVSEACELAGSCRVFALQKQRSTRAPGLCDGWRGPCEYELQAIFSRIGSVLKGGPPQGNRQVLFLLDGSGSVGDEEFEASVTFITKATRFLRSLEDCNSTVSVAQFSNDVRTEWEDTPGICANPEAFESTIKSMVRINGGTNIAAAITHAGKLLKKNSGCQPHAAKIIIIITDGRVDSYQSKEAHQVTAMLADEMCNTTMFAFGVGRGVDRAELLSILAPASGNNSNKYNDAEARYMDLFFKDEAPW